jgi:hypothetical protein
MALRLPRIPAYGYFSLPTEQRLQDELHPFEEHIVEATLVSVTAL